MAELVARLEEHFELVHQTRMLDVPIVNAKLQVKAIGFHAWQNHWLGVLITPWFMNLVLLPITRHESEGLKVGEHASFVLPAGPCEFMVNFEPEIGFFHTCSLMSPLTHIESQSDAEDIAQASLDIITQPSEGETQPKSPELSAEHNAQGHSPDEGKRAFLKRFMPSSDTSDTPPSAIETRR